VQQHLTCCPEALEESKDRSDGVLHTPIGIKSESRLARPDVTNRHGHPQLSASRLRDGRIEQAAAEHCQLEFTHRALEPEQQSVVRQARVVRGLAVDDTRADQAAELEQVMPVAPVASQTRCLQAEDRSDNALADLTDQTPEAGSIHRSARGYPKIVVDHAYVSEAVLAGEVCKGVLPPLALQVLLYLHARRLPDVHDRGAPRHAGRKLTVHRAPPRVVRLPRRPPGADERVRSRAPSGSLDRIRRCLRDAGGWEGRSDARFSPGLFWSSGGSCDRLSLTIATRSDLSSSRIARASRSAARLGWPRSTRRIDAQPALSNIQDGITTPDPSGRTQTWTSSPPRDSWYSTSTSSRNAGCHA
jgi:hypothetical protein